MCFSNQVSCTSLQNRNSKHMKRASQSTYTETPPPTYDSVWTTHITGGERRHVNLTYDSKGIFVDTKVAMSIFLINYKSLESNSRTWVLIPVILFADSIMYPCAGGMVAISNRSGVRPDHQVHVDSTYPQVLHISERRSTTNRPFFFPLYLSVLKPPPTNRPFFFQSARLSRIHARLLPG